MGDLAGTSSSATSHDSIGRTGKTDTPPDGDDDKVASHPTVSVEAFGNGQRLDVVLDDDRHAERSAQVAPDIDA
jgi:hypothetical protein